MPLFDILARDSESWVVACGANSDELLRHKPNPIHVKYRYRVYERVGGSEITCGGGGHWHFGVLEYCHRHDVYYMEVRETLRQDMAKDPYPKICNGQKFKLKIVPREEQLGESIKQKLKTVFKKRGVFWVVIKDLASLANIHGCHEVGREFVREGEDVYVQVNPTFVSGPCDLISNPCPPLLRTPVTEPAMSQQPQAPKQPPIANVTVYGRRNSQENASTTNIGVLKTTTYNVYSSNTMVTNATTAHAQRLHATPSQSSLHMHGTPVQHYRRLPQLSPLSTPKRLDSLPDEILLSPTMDDEGNEEPPLMHDTLLALTNRTDPSASKAALELVHDLSTKFVLTGTAPRSVLDSSNLGIQQRRDAVDLLLRLAKLATDSSKYPSGTEPIGVPKSIQDGVKVTISGCKDSLLSQRSSRDDRAVVMYFLGHLSEIEMFRTPIQLVGIAVFQQAVETTSSVSLHLLVEVLENFSTMTDLKFAMVVKPSELPRLYEHAVKHEAGQCLRGLLFNLLRDRDYDDVTVEYLKESVNYALEPPLEAQAKSAMLTIHRRLTETLAATRLERHSQVLKLRRDDMHGLNVVAPLLVVAQTVLVSGLLPQERVNNDEAGRWAETARTASIVLAFAGLFLGLVVAMSVLSYNSTITRTLEGIQHILDMKEQADSLVFAGGDLKVLNERSATKFVEQFSSRIQNSIREAGRLDHIAREHIHDGSQFVLLLGLSASCFMVAILFTSLATSSIEISLPVAVLLSAAVAYVITQDLRNRPGALKRVLSKLLMRRTPSNA
ncbi:hypothetical protein NMY22_g15503 [Coprinellus aureogranulatus]|nr:hypothetical protein NMY22_g15503 [Coprinellus aureogranulatus]